MDNIKSGIYCIENTITNKKYIGQSLDIEDRWRRHISELNNGNHHNDYLQKAWNKYGQDMFKFYVLEYCGIDILDNREIYYINYYNTLNREYGYNLKSGGQNGGSKYSEESRKKMSESQKRLCNNPDRIKRLRKIALDCWSNLEYKENRSGKNHPLYGTHHSKETKEKQSLSSKGKKKPPRSKEHCEALSKSLLGREANNKNKTPVKCIELNQIFEDAITAGKILEINHPNHVIDVCMKRRKTCNGYHFEFVDNNKNENIIGE